MSLKNTKTTCDYINFDTAQNTGIKLMNEKKTELLGFYIIVSINTGFRTSDIKRITFEQITTGVISCFEQKTGKHRTAPVNDNIKTAFKKLSTNGTKTGEIFKSQKNTVITTQQLNRLLKNAFEKLAKTNNISTHSLRKTFGRKIWEINNESDKSLTKLSEIFNHTNSAVTRRYLGIRQEELNDVYFQL